jgi:carbon-monoxide dehydrogenase medium subunit
VIPAAFEYARAGSVDEAIELLGREDAKLLAGGHSLIPLLRLRFARPSLLVDIGRLDELRYVREDGDRIAIGALSRHCELAGDSVLAKGAPLVAHVAGEVGDPQVRHRGTIGGSVSHGDPASDLGTILLTLDADFVARGPEGERTIPGAEFFTGPFETALGQQEILTEMRVPKVDGGVYLKHVRRAQDWATVGVAAARVNGGVNIGLAGMGAAARRGGGAGGGRRRVAGRRGREGGRRSGAAERRERKRRVPRPPRAGAHAPGPRAALRPCPR